jgi:hypothetical protein
VNKSLFSVELKNFPPLFFGAQNTRTGTFAFVLRSTVTGEPVPGGGKIRMPPGFTMVQLFDAVCEYTGFDRNAFVLGVRQGRVLAGIYKDTPTYILPEQIYIQSSKSTATPFEQLGSWLFMYPPKIHPYSLEAVCLDSTPPSSPPPPIIENNNNITTAPTAEQEVTLTSTFSEAVVNTAKFNLPEVNMGKNVFLCDVMEDLILSPPSSPPPPPTAVAPVCGYCESTFAPEHMERRKNGKFHHQDGWCVACRNCDAIGSGHIYDIHWKVDRSIPPTHSCTDCLSNPEYKKAVYDTGGFDGCDTWLPKSDVCKSCKSEKVFPCAGCKEKVCVFCTGHRYATYTTERGKTLYFFGGGSDHNDNKCLPACKHCHSIYQSNNLLRLSDGTFEHEPGWCEKCHKCGYVDALGHEFSLLESRAPPRACLPGLDGRSIPHNPDWRPFHLCYGCLSQSEGERLIAPRLAEIRAKMWAQYGPTACSCEGRYE